MYRLNNELHFVSRHFKQFTVPPIIVAENPIGSSAYYGWYWDSVYEIDGQEIYNENGLIVVSQDLVYGLEETLLHEYRHHIQFSLYGYWDDVPNPLNPFEQDARLFEVALGGLDEFTDEFKTPDLGRAVMLNLPGQKYLRALVID